MEAIIVTIEKIPTIKENNSKSVLITGGAGFVGSNLCEKLLKDDVRVYCVDNLITGKRKNIERFLTHPNFFFFELDIVCADFKAKFENINVGRVFHLACPTGVPNIKKHGEEMLLTSSAGTLNVLEIARLHRASILFSSSAEVYGNPLVSPQSENYSGNVNPIGPRSAYEEGKRFSESLMMHYSQKYGVDAKIVRIFNTYGPGMSLDDQRVIPQFINAIASNGELKIFGDGSQTRTHLYVDDLLSGLMLVMEKGNCGEVFNIGGEKQVTIKELAGAILRVAKRENGIKYVPHFIEDHSHRQPSTDKVQKLGWKQIVTLEEGLRRILAANGLQY